MSKLYKWIAWKLPHELVMWCAMRVAAHATQGQYSNQVVPELTAMDALERWDEYHVPQNTAGGLFVAGSDTSAIGVLG